MQKTNSIAWVSQTDKKKDLGVWSDNFNYSKELTSNLTYKRMVDL